MNTTQTPPAPTLSPLAHALLADLDHPDLSELDLCRRHGLTLDELRTQARAPAFRHAVSIIREIRELRRPLIQTRAEADAARTLSALTARDPTSATAAKEVRLAVKDLLRLLGASSPGAGAFQAPDRPKGDARSQLPGAEAFQASDRAQPEPPSPQPTPNHSPDPEAAHPESGGVGAAAPKPQAPHSVPTPATTTPLTPRPSPHKPKHPRGTKPRPKARGR